MLTPKQNLLELLKPNGKPDRLVNQYQPFVPVMEDPCGKFTRGNRIKGLTTKDRWGTEIAWPEEQFAAMPHVTAANKVLPDITRWQEYIKVPDIVSASSDPELWKPAMEAAAQVDRDKYASYMQNVLKRQTCIEITEGEVTGLSVENGTVTGIQLAKKDKIEGKTVILTPGTFLNGTMYIGSEKMYGGRIEEKQ